MALAGAGSVSADHPPAAGCPRRGRRLALGLALPARAGARQRVGYFVYPLGLAAWLLLRGGGTVVGDLSRSELEHGRLAVHSHIESRTPPHDSMTARASVVPVTGHQHPVDPGRSRDDHALPEDLGG
jgi:hypothetical protein